MGASRAEGVDDYGLARVGLGGSWASGKLFVEDEERLARRYPNLSRRFGAEPLG